MQVEGHTWLAYMKRGVDAARRDCGSGSGVVRIGKVEKSTFEIFPNANLVTYVSSLCTKAVVVKMTLSTSIFLNLVNSYRGIYN